ncbi:terpene synthase family protein [Streptomyces sp. NPDC050617]|uniref:terpene synthase family protein n=1 Tax=Streptomyces sp. NPDC050617 TaxID=3154628 RepID=UPI003425A821
MTTHPDPLPGLDPGLEPGSLARLRDGSGTCRFRLPHMPKLVALRQHRDTEAVETASNEWIRTRLGPAFDDIEQRLAERNGLWAGMTHPNADTAWVQTLADVLQYMFILDDIAAYDVHNPDHPTGTVELSGLFEEIHAVMRGEPQHPSSLMGEVFAELFVRATNPMSGRQRERLRGHITTMLEGFAEEIAIVAQGRTLGFDDYLDLHMISVGMDWVYLLIETGLGLDLSRDMDAPGESLSGLHELVTRVLIYQNDIMGFRRDVLSGDPMNGVTALMHEHGLALQEAVDTLYRMFCQSEEEFVALGARIITDHPSRADLKAYVEELRYLLAGDIHWHHLARRYHGSDHQWNGLTSGTLHLTPDRTLYLPDTPDTNLRTP